MPSSATAGRQVKQQQGCSAAYNHKKRVSVITAIAKSVSHRHAPDGLPLPLARCTHIPAVADSVVINEERLHLKRIANSFGQRLFQSQPHRTDVLRKPPHVLLKEECCAVSSCMTLRCCMLHDAYLDSGHAEQEMLHIDHDVRQRVGYL